MRNERLIIPSELQKQVMEQIHTGHQGISKCRERTRRTVWWPGLLSEIENVAGKCQSCCMNQARKTEPMIPSTFPELTWQKIGIDVFEWQKLVYLIIMNYYSRFIKIAKLDRTTAEAEVQRCKNIFSRHGIT